MSRRHFSPARLAAGAVLTGALAMASGVAAQAHTTARSAAASSTVVGAFSGSIRTGPLADLSLTGSIGLHLDNATHTITGVLVDGDGAGHGYVLAHISGHIGAHAITLVFHTASGRTISGSSTSLPSPTKILRGSLTTAGGRGDWLEVPPGPPQDATKVFCLIGVPCQPVLKNPPHGSPAPPNPSPPADGPSGGDYNNTYCNELEMGLNLDDPTVIKLLQDQGCDVT